MSSIRNLGLAFLLLCGASVALFELQPQLKYNLRDPIYHRLKARIFDPEPRRFDVAFIGSSHIWNAVDTEAINGLHPGQFTYNFGVNWFGNDTKLVIVRDLLEHKPVGSVVLEITGGDDHEWHEYFKSMGTLADARRIIRTSGAKLTARDFLTLSPQFRTEMEHTGSLLLPFSVKGLYFAFREYWWKIPPVPTPDHAGFLPIKSVFNFPDPSFVVADSDDSRSEVVLSSSLQEIGRLCRKHKVKLYFLFVPQRNEAYPGQKFLGELKKWGQPVVLDSRRIYPPQLWYNSSHLNTAGATIFTDMLLQSAIFQH